MLQRHVGIETLQRSVLVLQLLEPFDVRRLQPALLGLPLIVGRGTDAVAPPDLVDGAPSIGLFQDRHDLGLGEFRLAHGNLLAKVAIVPEDSPCGMPTFQGSLRCEER